MQVYSQLKLFITKPEKANSGRFLFLCYFYVIENIK